MEAHIGRSKRNINANENHCMPQVVIDVTNISGQWESLVNEAEHCLLCLALMMKMNL